MARPKDVADYAEHFASLLPPYAKLQFRERHSLESLLNAHRWTSACVRRPTEQKNIPRFPVLTNTKDLRFRQTFDSRVTCSSTVSPNLSILFCTFVENLETEISSINVEKSSLEWKTRVQSNKVNLFRHLRIYFFLAQYENIISSLKRITFIFYTRVTKRWSIYRAYNLSRASV